MSELDGGTVATEVSVDNRPLEPLNQIKSIPTWNQHMKYDIYVQSNLCLLSHLYPGDLCLPLCANLQLYYIEWISWDDSESQTANIPSLLSSYELGRLRSREKLEVHDIILEDDTNTYEVFSIHTRGWAGSTFSRSSAATRWICLAISRCCWNCSGSASITSLLSIAICLWNC